MYIKNVHEQYRPHLCPCGLSTYATITSASSPGPVTPPSGHTSSQSEG